MAEQLHPRQARRSFLGVAAAAMLSLALAGCQVIPRSDRAPRLPEPVAVEEPAPATPQPNLPDDEGRNRVAVLVPLTGDNAGIGQSIANAANLAVLDTGGERIRVTVYDTAPSAALAANEAIADGNRLILGPLLAQNVEAVAPIARRADVPVISFSNDVDVAGDGVYILGFNPAQSIDRVVRYARDQGVERFAGLIPDGIYGRRASQALIASVENSGGRMVAMQNYDRSPAALDAAIDRLHGQSGYDAVLIADNGRIAIAAADDIRRGPSGEAKILGTELWQADASLTQTPALHGSWFASVSDGMFAQFRDRYRARYRENPYRLASLGYDAVLLAVRLSGNEWRIGEPFPARALRNPDGFTGVDGAFRFGANGIADRSLEVQQVTADGFTTVSPAPKGFAD